MLEKIKEHKMLIAILTLLVVSNLFTIALFVNKQDSPTLKINDNDTPETNIIEDSPGSSWYGDVTNNQPVVEQEKITVKNPTKVPTYAYRTMYQYYTINLSGEKSETCVREGYPPVPWGNELVIVKTWQEKYISGYEYK